MYQQALNLVQWIVMVSYMFGERVCLELSYHHSKFHTDKMSPNLINFQLEKNLESLRTRKERCMLGV